MNHGGSAGPLREGKGTTFEGGQRVPCVMWGPGRIPAGTECDELMGTIDLLPTIPTLTNTPLPGENKIDGLDASKLLLGDENGESPRDEFLYYTSRGAIEGIHQGKWKLLVKPKGGGKGKGQGKDQKIMLSPDLLLFDLEVDIGEQNNLAGENPDVVKKLRDRMTELDAEVGANAREPWVKG
ncbi:MAG: sulfatase-like hydrolase/transferase [Verrucomicrobiales bacterium]